MAGGNSCPVCGYTGLDEPAQFPGGGWSYEICPSCGFQYGVTDGDKHFTYESWRERWIAGGMKWYSFGVVSVPENWDPQKQLDDLLRDNS